MKHHLKKHLAAISLFSLFIAPASFASITGFSAITSFDPNTYFSGGVDAGIDFDDGSPTQSGFTGISNSNNKTYSVVNNGITFDINVTTTTSFGSNQNRDRGNGGDLVRDFEQWLSTSGGKSEAHVQISGLSANSGYDIDFFMYNVGFPNDVNLEFYNGTSSSDPLLTTFQSSGEPSDTSTWSPGITLSATSNGSGVIDFAVRSTSDRLTINGMSLVAVPEPSSVLLLGLCALGLMTYRRR